MPTKTCNICKQDTESYWNTVKGMLCDNCYCKEPNIQGGAGYYCAGDYCERQVASDNILFCEHCDKGCC